MPRRLRIEIPGGVYHVMNRGVNRADIVRVDEERHEWFRFFCSASLLSKIAPTETQSIRLD